jgi:hypothetical protein
MGNTWIDCHVDNYNRFNEQVEKRERMYKDAVRGSECFNELEFYKDQRHKCFVQLMDINNT